MIFTIYWLLPWKPYLSRFVTKWHCGYSFSFLFHVQCCFCKLTTWQSLEAVAKYSVNPFPNNPHFVRRNMKQQKIVRRKQMWRCQANLHYSMQKRRMASQRLTPSDSPYKNQIISTQRIQFFRQRNVINGIAITNRKLTCRLQIKCAPGN